MSKIYKYFCGHFGKIEENLEKILLKIFEIS